MYFLMETVTMCLVLFFTVNEQACSARSSTRPRSSCRRPSAVCGRGHSEAARPPPADIPVRISNHSSSLLRLRWVDTERRAPPSHALTLGSACLGMGQNGLSRERHHLMFYCFDFIFGLWARGAVRPLRGICSEKTSEWEKNNSVLQYTYAFD